MFHINNLIDMPSVANPTAKNLRNFISNCQENMQALLALKHDVKRNNGILSTLLLRKIDSDLRKKFEEGREDSQKMPEVQEIIKYLENECSHLEAASLSQNSTVRSTVVNSSQNLGKATWQTPKPFSRTSKTVLCLPLARPIHVRSVAKQTTISIAAMIFVVCHHKRNMTSLRRITFVLTVSAMATPLKNVNREMFAQNVARNTTLGFICQRSPPLPKLLPSLIKHQTMKVGLILFLKLDIPQTINSDLTLINCPGHLRPMYRPLKPQKCFCSVLTKLRQASLYNSIGYYSSTTYLA